jgi:hypothetical protein
MISRDSGIDRPKAWTAPGAERPPQFIWFQDDHGNRYFAPPSHLHGHCVARGNVLTIRHGENATITITGSAVMDLVESLGAGRAQGIRANGTDLLSVVILTEADAAAAKVHLPAEDEG